MRKFMLLTAVLGFSCLPLAAQDYPRGEVAGNYTYVRIKTGVSGVGDFNCQGGGGSAAWNANSYLGVVGEFSGCKITGLPSGVSGHVFTYLFGPRLTYRGSGGFEPFAEALFGGAHIGGTVIGSSGSDNAFSMAIGGGADYKVTRSVAIRLVQFDYLYTKFNEGSGAPQHQNNFRLQAGIVFRFGER
jgi:opacity protein-like surface antigen